MRLRLAALSPDDEQAFLTATRRSRRVHRPWVKPPTTSQGFQDFVRGIGPTRERLLLWGRPPRTAGDVSDELLGYFSLGEIVRGNLNSAFLGYWGVVPHISGGFMADGMEMLLRYAFRSLRLHRLEANVQPENHSSIALARHSGFRKEGFSPRYLKIAGRWRDHERWALTVEDWRSRS